MKGSTDGIRRSLFDAEFLEVPLSNHGIDDELEELFAAPLSEKYLVRRPGGDAVGPLSVQVISRLLLEGALPKNLEVCFDGRGDWTFASQQPVFSQAIAGQELRQSHKAMPAFVPAFRSVLDERGAFSALLEAAKRNETGWLRFTRAEVEVLIAFRQGRPTSVSSTDPAQSDEQLLLAECRVNELQLKDARAFAVQHHIGVLAALVEIKAIAAQAVPKILRENAEQRLLSLLLWDCGEARFDLDLSAGQERDDLEGTVLEVCLKAFSSLDERELLAAIGALDVEVIRSNADPEILQNLNTEEMTFLGRFSTGGILESLIDSENEDELRLYYRLSALRLLEKGNSGQRAFKKFALQFLSAADLVLLGVTPDASRVQLQAAVEKVSASVAAALQGNEAHPLANQVKNRLKLLMKRMRDPTALEIMRRANSMGLDPDDEGVRLALETEYLQEELEKRFSATQYDDAMIVAERLLALAPDDIDAQALHLQARAHLASKEDAKIIFAKVQELLREYESNVNVLAAGVAATSNLDKNIARSWLNKLRVLAPAHPLVLKKKNASTKRKKEKRSVEVGYDFFKTIGIAGAAFGLLWAASVGMKLGAGEGGWTGTSWFWWVRRAVLMSVAVVGWTQVNEGGLADFFKVKWLESPKILLIAILLGSVSGLLSGGGPTETALPVLIGLAIIHVVAEQFFFIWFMLRSLLAHVKHPLVAVVTTAIFYGLYHTSYYYYFTALAPATLAYWIMLFILGGGVPYALLYAKNRTVVPVLICHLLVQMIALLKWL